MKFKGWDNFKLGTELWVKLEILQYLRRQAIRHKALTGEIPAHRGPRHRAPDASTTPTPLSTLLAPRRPRCTQLRVCPYKRLASPLPAFNHLQKMSPLFQALINFLVGKMIRMWCKIISCVQISTSLNNWSIQSKGGCLLTCRVLPTQLNATEFCQGTPCCFQVHSSTIFTPPPTYSGGAPSRSAASFS